MADCNANMLKVTVRLYGKEVNLSEIGDTYIRKSYRYTAHATHDPVSSY